MRMMNEARSVFGGTDFWKKNEWALGLLSFATSILTMTVVPFTRKDFGERYLGWINLYFGYSALASYIFFGNIFAAFTRHGSSSLMPPFWLAFIGLSIYHRMQISRRNKEGVEWHSMYMGTSVFQLPFSRELVIKYCEPLTVFVAGLFFWQFAGQVGLWLMFSAASLFVNNQIVFFQERQTILDMRDARIEARYMGEALAGKPASETAGFVVAESSVKLIGTDASLVDAFDKLSSDLKSILDAPVDTTVVGEVSDVSSR